MTRAQPGAQVLLWCMALAALAVVLFPFYWMLNTSLKPPAEVFASPPTFVSAHWSLDAYAAVLRAAGFGELTTEIKPLSAFYLAEGRHQQYLHRHPRGYCSMRGTGVPCPASWAPDPGVVAG